MGRNLSANGLKLMSVEISMDTSLQSMALFDEISGVQEEISFVLYCLF